MNIDVNGAGRKFNVQHTGGVFADHYGIAVGLVKGGRRSSRFDKSSVEEKSCILLDFLAAMGFDTKPLTQTPSDS